MASKCIYKGLTHGNNVMSWTCNSIISSIWDRVYNEMKRFIQKWYKYRPSFSLHCLLARTFIFAECFPKKAIVGFGYLWTVQLETQFCPRWRFEIDQVLSSPILWSYPPDFSVLEIERVFCEGYKSIMGSNFKMPKIAM